MAALARSDRQVFLTRIGVSFPEIAAELVLSPHTIKSQMRQMRSVYRKLGVSSRNQAVMRAP